MILFIECAAACILFGAGIIASVLIKKEAWLQDYAPEVQQRFLETHPDYVRREKKENTIRLIVAKTLVSLLFAALLSAMVYIAGARDFLTGVLYSYIIWVVVNVFDVIVLDMLVFPYWKRIRLPGTEDMDREYSSNWRKHVLDGFYGMVIGLPVACVCGLCVHLISMLMK